VSERDVEVDTVPGYFPGLEVGFSILGVLVWWKAFKNI
jgi:hypothetical protein